MCLGQRAGHELIKSQLRCEKGRFMPFAMHTRCTSIVAVAARASRVRQTVADVTEVNEGEYVRE